MGFAHASFDGTTLTDADCTGADFYEARFIESHLRGTNFSGADMKDVVFVGAVEARGANIFGARFDPTLEIGEDETITSATEIELRLGFVRVDTKMASRTEEVDVILR